MTSQFAPAFAGRTWTIVIVAAILWSIGRRSRKRLDWRIFATAAIAAALVVITLAMSGAGPRAANAIISSFVAACYAVAGIWTGRRFVALAILLMAAIALGWFVLPQWLFLCIGIGGGGTLLAGGLWLRRA